MAASTVDNSYRPAIYRARGGKQLVVKATATQTVFGGLAIGSGGALGVKSGGSLTVDSGGTQSMAGVLTVSSGGQVTFAAGAATVRPNISATASIALTAANSGARYLSGVVGIIFTLPSAPGVGNGVSFKITTVSGGHSVTGGAIDFKLRPASADTVFGLVAGATDSEVVNLLGTGSVVGAGLEVVSDGVNWVIVEGSGEYSRAAAT